jgi:hypothetical protein
MSKLDARLQATGIRLTKKYGALIDYWQYSSGGGDYNPATGDSSAVTGSSNYFKRLALITDQAGNRVNPKDGQILDAGTLVQGGDKWIYMLSDKPPPVLQDQCMIKGVRYTIKDVQTFGPSGTDILYLCVVKQ